MEQSVPMDMDTDQRISGDYNQNEEPDRHVPSNAAMETGRTGKKNPVKMAVQAAKMKVKASGHFYDDRSITDDVRESFTKSQIAAYREAFRLFDKDGNGVISTAEVRTVLMSMGQDPAERNVKGMFTRHDEDGSGCIDFLEFIKIVSLIQDEEEDEDELVAVFRVLDQDGDGYITKADLRHVVVMLDVKFTATDLEEMISVADKDGDGMIGYEEFTKIIMSKY